MKTLYKAWILATIIILSMAYGWHKIHNMKPLLSFSDGKVIIEGTWILIPSAIKTW